MGWLDRVARFVARRLLGLDPAELAEVIRELREIRKLIGERLSEERRATPLGRARVINTTILMRVDPDRAKKVIGSGRRVVNGVAVILGPNGLARVRFRPSTADRAREIINELRRTDGEIIGSETIIKITRYKDR